MTLQINASTPGEARDEIVKWLETRAIEEGIDSRKAKLKSVSLKHNHREAALSAAARFIKATEIKSLPKQTNCPNCGEEML